MLTDLLSPALGHGVGAVMFFRGGGGIVTEEGGVVSGNMVNWTGRREELGPGEGGVLLGGLLPGWACELVMP